MQNNQTRLELSRICQKINDGGVDLRELYLSLHATLVAMRADGDEVPADANELEHKLELEMVAEFKAVSVLSGAVANMPPSGRLET